MIYRIEDLMKIAHIWTVISASKRRCECPNEWAYSCNFCMTSTGHWFLGRAAILRERSPPGGWMRVGHILGLAIGKWPMAWDKPVNPWMLRYKTFWHTGVHTLKKHCIGVYETWFSSGVSVDSMYYVRVKLTLWRYAYPVHHIEFTA